MVCFVTEAAERKAGDQGQSVRVIDFQDAYMVQSFARRSGLEASARGVRPRDVAQTNR